MASKKKKTGKRIVKKAPEAAPQPAAKPLEELASRAGMERSAASRPSQSASLRAPQPRAQAAKPRTQAPKARAAASSGNGGVGLADAELGRRIRGLLSSDPDFRDALQAAVVRELLGDELGSARRPSASAAPAAAPAPATRPSPAPRKNGDSGKRSRMSPAETQEFDVAVEEAIRNVADENGARRADVMLHLGLSGDDAAKVSQAAKRLAKAGHIEVDSSRGRASTVWRPL